MRLLATHVPSATSYTFESASTNSFNVAVHCSSVNRVHAGKQSSITCHVYTTDKSLLSYRTVDDFVRSFYLV